MKYKRRNDPDFWKMARSFLHDYMPVVRNLSDKSVDAYKQSLYSYLDFLKVKLDIEQGSVSFECFYRTTVKEYIAWMKSEKNYTVKTINLRLTALKAFLKYCSEEDIELATFYAEIYSIKGLKDNKKPILYLSDEEIKGILSAINIESSKSRRNRMILILMYDSAARVQELSDLMRSSLHLDAKQPFVTLVGKGRKTRNVPLMNKTVQHLKEYLREFHPKDLEQPLFYSYRDGYPHKLSTDSIGLILKKAAESARSYCPNMSEDVHCHLIRKTRAMDLYRQGIPLPFIMQLLGHENISTTSNFYAFATLDMMYEAIKKTIPTSINEPKNWSELKITKVLYTLD